MTDDWTQTWEANEYAPFGSEWQAHEAFEMFLNDIGETVTLFGYEYDPARLFKLADPIAYREEFNNWLDSQQND